MRVAQHLLYPLSVAENYTIDHHYEGLEKRHITECPCDAHDRLIGNVGDTSFGKSYCLYIFTQICLEI